MSCNLCHNPPILLEPVGRSSAIIPLRTTQDVIVSFLMPQRFNFKVQASTVGSSSDNSSKFSKRIEQAWLISQQPTPIACSSCTSKGCVECKWCAGFHSVWRLSRDWISCEVVRTATNLQALAAAAFVVKT